MTLSIENHRLQGARVTYDPDEDRAPLTPEIAVIHYAVTEDATTTANVLKARDYLSCHVSIDNDGDVIQQVPFDRRAYHAGRSNYRGRESVNTFSLGIEIANPGPLIRRPSGALETVYGKLWTGGAIEARHKSGVAPSNWTHWATYSETELALVVEICGLWRDVYGITDVVGHDDVSPGRKFDPGPAFPIEWVRTAVFGRVG